MSIQNGKSLVLNKNTRAMVQGPSGSGKTILSGYTLRYPQARPVHWLDFDLRLESLQTVFSEKDFEHLTYESFRDGAVPGSAFQAAVLWVNKMLLAYRKEDPALPRTIVLDSLTFAARSAMVGVLHADGKPSDMQPYQDHYGKMGAKVEDLISKLTALPCNVLVSAHERLIEDKVTGRIYQDLDIINSLRNRIPGYFNERWHTEVTPAGPNKPAAYVVRTKSGHNVDARTCYASLEVIEPAAEVWHKIELEKAMRNAA